MRILYVAPMNSIHSRRWIKFFVDKGHDVHVVNVGFAERSHLDGVTEHVVKLDHSTYSFAVDLFKRFLPFRRTMKQVIREVRPDLVHVHGVNAYAYIVHQCGFHPIVTTAWGSEILLEPGQSLKYRLIVTRVLKKADAVTCDAEHIKEEMIRLGAPRERVHILFFGTDLDEWTPAKRDPSLAAALGFPKGAKIVISLRQLKPIYDIPTFIRSIPLIAKQNPEARFVIASDGPEKPKLIGLAEELGVEHLVRFVGFLSDEDLQRYTASADVYVSTSLSDAGLAASTAEAMASRVPVVITDFGNNRDWVEQGVSGLLFPLGDHEALAQRVCELLSDEAKAREFAASGRNVIESRNNWRTQMEKVEMLYQRTVSR